MENNGLKHISNNIKDITTMLKEFNDRMDKKYGSTDVLRPSDESVGTSGSSRVGTTISKTEGGEK